MWLCCMRHITVMSLKRITFTEFAFPGGELQFHECSVLWDSQTECWKCVQTFSLFFFFSFTCPACICAHLLPPVCQIRVSEMCLFCTHHGLNHARRCSSVILQCDTMRHLKLQLFFLNLDVATLSWAMRDRPTWDQHRVPPRAKHNWFKACNTFL